MYTEISHNKWKSIGLITVFLVLVIGLGWLFSYILDNPIILPLAVILAITQALAAFFVGDQIALAAAGAREAPRKDPYLQLHRLVENLAITAGIPKPKIYIIDDAAPNAFATGRDPKRASIAVTTGILKKLNKTELEGVIAHELAHIGNYDTRVMVIVVVLVGILSLVSDFFLRSLWWGSHHRSRNNNNGQGVLMLIALLFAILAPIIALLIQTAVSRKREYLADATGALLTRYPEGLARALEKISQSHHRLRRASSATNHLYISNPLREEKSWLATIFSTHPPIKERVKKLRSMINLSTHK